MFSFFKKSPMKQLSDLLRKDDDFFVSYMLSAIDILEQNSVNKNYDRLVYMSAMLCAYSYSNQANLSYDKLQKVISEIETRYWKLTHMTCTTIN